MLRGIIVRMKPKDKQPVPDEDNADKAVVLLIDGNNIAFRAASILPRSVLEANDTRQADSMVARRLRIMNSLYAHVVPVYVFDEPHNDFMPFDAAINRKREDTAYKANRRKPANDELARMKAIWIQSWMQRMYSDGNIVLAYPGAEADDLIAYASKLISTGPARQDGLLTAIWSADKDLLQCVHDGTGVYQIRKRGADGEVKYTESVVMDVKGVPASKIRMQLALQGDNADGYPGVHGYGAKKGLRLINECGSIDELVAALPEHEDLLRENWRLAGMGEDYLPTEAMNRVRTAVADAIGPEF